MVDGTTVDAAEPVEAFVRSYYDALGSGDPLGAYFADDPSAVKFGISEALYGADAIRDGLREQTRTTTDWSVSSRRLTTGAHDAVGWFSDDVDLAWHDRTTDRSQSWETRWSGTLRHDGGSWSFVGMHVSAPHDL